MKKFKKLTRESTLSPIDLELGLRALQGESHSKLSREYGIGYVAICSRAKRVLQGMPWYDENEWRNEFMRHGVGDLQALVNVYRRQGEDSLIKRVDKLSEFAKKLQSKMDKILAILEMRNSQIEYLKSKVSEYERASLRPQ